MARRTVWEDQLLSITIGSGSQGAVDLMPGLVQDEGRGMTLTRMIGALSLFSTSVAGAYGVQILDVGIAVIDRDAVASCTIPGSISQA